MKIIDIKGLDKFLEEQEAAVLSVPIDDKGTIHSAALLYAHSDDPLCFIFVTGGETEKCKLLAAQKEAKGSCIIGTSRGTPFSLQMRGIVTLKAPTEASHELDIYEAKRGKRSDDVSSSNQVVLIFKPTWARCTDYISEDFKDGFMRHQIDL